MTRVSSPWHAPASGLRRKPVFYYCIRKASHLDGSYAAFGKIIEGMDVVDKLAEVATDWSDMPLTPVIMEKVTVETFGEDYPEPKTV